MFRFFRVFTISLFASALAFVLAGPVSAEPGVTMSVTVKGDFLHIDSVSKSPQPEPKLRMNASPKFLEVAFPKTALTSKPLTKAIDKGLIQKIQTLSKNNTSLARIFFVSKPKTKLSKIDGGYRYTVHLNQMAPASKAPARKVSAKPATKKTPVKVLTNKPADKTPVKVLTNKPTGKTPVKVLTNKPTGKSPRTVSAAAPKKVTTPVTVVFKDKPLVDAVAELAQKAGLKPIVDPSLTGSVNLSLNAMPFHKAVDILLGPYGDTVRSRVDGKTFLVSRVQKTVVKAAPTGPTVIDYFPFGKKDAKKMMNAARKGVPELNYRVDSDLNILIVEGSAADVAKLNQILRQSAKK